MNVTAIGAVVIFTWEEERVKPVIIRNVVVFIHSPTFCCLLEMPFYTNTQRLLPKNLARARSSKLKQKFSQFFE